ncbi:MAG TPA: hypothetical protein VFE62_26235 [Gemmataceae bacterium]|nr:hypothetical protein [Gemmataceae bacterium]
MTLQSRIHAVMAEWADAGDDVPEELKIIREQREAVRFYEDRLRPVTDSETGATEDEIDRLTLALGLATQDKKRYAANLHDLQCAVREAMVRIEAEKFDLSKSASPHEVLFTKCAQRDLDIVKECCGDLI